MNNELHNVCECGGDIDVRLPGEYICGDCGICYGPWFDDRCHERMDSRTRNMLDLGHSRPGNRQHHPYSRKTYHRECMRNEFPTGSYIPDVDWAIIEEAAERWKEGGDDREFDRLGVAVRVILQSVDAQDPSPKPVAKRPRKIKDPSGRTFARVYGERWRYILKRLDPSYKVKSFPRRLAEFVDAWTNWEFAAFRKLRELGETTKKTNYHRNVLMWWCLAEAQKHPYLAQLDPEPSYFLMLWKRPWKTEAGKAKFDAMLHQLKKHAPFKFKHERMITEGGFITVTRKKRWWE